MIAELAAANAAFAVIKTAVQNGGDLLAAGQSLGQYFSAKTSLQKKVNEKSGTAGRSDLEEFLALQQLKEREAELKQLMIYSGKAGMWEEWLQYQSAQKQKRIDAERKAKAEAIRRKKKIVDWVLGISLSIAILTGVGMIGYIFYYISRNT